MSSAGIGSVRPDVSHKQFGLLVTIYVTHRERVSSNVVTMTFDSIAKAIAAQNAIEGAHQGGHTPTRAVCVLYTM